MKATIQKLAVSLSIYMLLILCLSTLRCEKGLPVNGEPPVELPPPPPPRVGCPFKHVEFDDTTRSYMSWGGTTLRLNTSYVHVRFAPGVTDSAALALADKYGLKVTTMRAIFRGIRFYMFCVPDGKRAEQFFTPYGKPHIQNFGAEPLVDAAFAVFENGAFSIPNDFLVQFDSSVTRAAIDSINTLYHVVLDSTFILADQLWYDLRVTKQSPYSGFDMVNLYHCLKEVRLAGGNAHGFNPPFGEKCTPVSYSGSRVLSKGNDLKAIHQFVEGRNQR